MNFIDATVEKAGDGFSLCFGEVRIHSDKKELEPYVGKTVVVGIRPEDFHYSSKVPGLVAMMIKEGNFGHEREDWWTVPRESFLDKVHVFDKDTEKAVCH